MEKDYETNTKNIVYLIGNTKSIRRIRRRINLFAATHKEELKQDIQLNVLLRGETGVGKEVVARLLHEQFEIAGEFVALNSSDFESNLLKNELYGHKKGSFTGAASDENGFFQRAQKGTLFLDEIGDMPLDMQSKLLRVLEDRTFYRVGSNQLEKSEISLLITATNKDLRQLIKENMFREDFYSRIRVHRFDIPPLRDRTDDLPSLIEHFCRQFNHAPLDFSDEAMKLLQGYPWPRNVRELRTVVELCRTYHKSSKPIEVNDLCEWYEEFSEYVKPPNCKRANQNNNRYCWEIDPITDPQALIEQAIDCSECEQAQNHHQEIVRIHSPSGYEAFVLRTYPVLVEMLKTASGMHEVDSDKVTFHEFKNQMSHLAEKKWLEDFIKKYGMNRELLMEKLKRTRHRVNDLLRKNGFTSKD